MSNVLKAFCRAISTLLIVAVVCGPLVLLAGCEKEEIVTERQVEVKDKVIQQETVVE